MCEPVSLGIASLLIGTASAGAGLMGQMSQGAATRSRNAMQEANDRQALNDNYTQGSTQQYYRNVEAEQKLQTNSRAARSAEATALTSAGEAGVQGTSVTALQAEYDAKSGEYQSDVEFNRKAENDALTLEMKGFKSQAQSQINQLQDPAPPDYLGAIAGVAESGFNAYNRFIYKAPSVSIPGGMANTDPAVRY